MAAYIGCSGYNYRHWRGGVFYPKNITQKEEFNYYTSQFDTVELNSTFYGIPSESTWQKWHDRAPEGFIYAVKANRFITHRNRIDVFPKFYSGASLLNEHLGPILFQFPPVLGVSLEKLESLARLQPPDTRFALEFRHPSWNQPEVYKFLHDHNWTYVTISHPSLPEIHEVTADFVYLRFHGSKRLYSSEYTGRELEGYAKLIRKYLEKNRAVYAYFNNDAFGFAPKNALELKKLLA